MFLRSELDLAKDRLLADLRKDIVPTDPRNVALATLGWTIDLRNPLEHVAGFGIRFDPQIHGYWIDALPQLSVLVRDCGATLHQLEDRRIEIRLGDIRVTPATFQEIGALVEIFRDEVYSVECASPMFAWDVGANCGFASLYFAGSHGWDVAAYELCGPTADAARENVTRSGLDSKIQVHAAGVGGKNETMQITYSSDLRGSNGILGNIATDPHGVEQPLPVEVRDASDVFAAVQKEANGRPILVKLDCEGAEYAILERLLETGQLAEISALVIEAHCFPGLEPGMAVNTLLKAGFLVRRVPRMTEPLQILFASRMAK